MQIKVNDLAVRLTNLDKILWPEPGYTKHDLINYYIQIYPLIKSYLKDRPLSLKIYPDGIKGSSFYMKNCPDHSPDWLSTGEIFSRKHKESTNWIMINKRADLLWVANHASLELHCWFSRASNPDIPDFAVFDLDPGQNTTFQDTIEITLLIKDILAQLKMKAFLKTSGQTGLHVFIPVKPVYSYKQIRHFLKNISTLVAETKPELATIAWQKKKRQGKLYLDYRQIARSKTIPAPFSLRPTPEATISTPLAWSELKPDLNPAGFNLDSIFNRIEHSGNPWQDILHINQNLPGPFV